jgi:hypothetical protein
VGSNIDDFEVHFSFNNTEWIEVARSGHPSDVDGLPGNIEIVFEAPD